MLKAAAPVSLSRILAIRMTVVSISVSLLLTLILFVHYLANTSQLCEAALHRAAYQIADALAGRRDPADIPLYREYPSSYGFRVYDRRLLATRHILASANTRWLPPVQRATATKLDPDGDHDTGAVGTDLLEGFQQIRAAGPGGNHIESLLIHREVLGEKKYWIQVYMIGDPAWTTLGIVRDKLMSHVVLPVLFIMPALTLAIFLTTRRALRPLRKLSRDAVRTGNAVARGQPLTPLSDHSMVREFADVAAAINATLGKLEHSLKTQKQFTSDAAHELRTPLSVLLLETSRLPRDAARDRIKSDLQELGSLVNELLRFAQAEDVMVHELADVDIVAVVRRVCEDAAPGAIERGQFIEFESAVPRQIVAGNAVLIEIAIRNLIDNALKYTEAGMTVTVRVAKGARIFVEDQGPGIPPEQQQKVFDRYWRADRRIGNGSGIGLSLVKRIAQLHDGTIAIENRHDGGARLVFTVGRARAERGSASVLTS